MGKAMVDAARLADELRAEQDHASAQASSKQSLNNQFGQLEARLADAENAAARGGKAAMAKLESKVHELEAELAGTQARTGESAKAYQRAERKCKELAFTSGEDRKNQDRMTDLASKLQSKIKTYKQQIEEAEEIAALNLAKFRTLICQLKLEENLTKSGIRLCDNTPTTVKIQKLPRCRLQIPDMKQCFPNPTLDVALGLSFHPQQVLCSHLLVS